MPHPSNPRLLQLIAIFKFVKAAALLGSLAVFLKLLRQGDPAHQLVQWVLSLHVDPDNRYLREVIALLLRVDATHAAALIAGMLSYAFLFTVEGVGLWTGQRWAAYLTIVATAGFIPFELLELAQHAGGGVLLLGVNLAIVIVLVRHLHGARRLRRTG